VNGGDTGTAGIGGGDTGTAGIGGGDTGTAGIGGGDTGGTASGGNANGGVSAGGSGGSYEPPTACNLPTPVSFQKNIQGFLATSCGKAVSGGCHVTDASKTSLGYDHAYDWITAIAHTSSCGKTQPYVKRFEVVLAVIAAAKPASCPNSGQMPPAGMGTPLTDCQIDALRAWLSEPMVSQMHVPETDDTAALYPPGPYLMPPFN
jgi:hypothetical protein